MGVSAFATASTGSAIAGLSGAAATNATLAWLGGGAIAAGGGGMAAGAVVLVAERLYRRSLLQTQGRLSMRQAWSAPE